jgi:RND family efflux transporter MFP subunit
MTSRFVGAGRWSRSALAALALVAFGAAAMYFVMRTVSRSAPEVTSGGSSPAPVPGAPDALETSAPVQDLVVRMSPDLVRRAGLELATAMSGATQSRIRLSGTVTPNAYGQVAVTPLVAGRVTRVAAELGARVRRGQMLAEIYSPELAAAQTRYTSIRAELSAHDRELRRTEKLVEIGAASQQELERIHAEHAARTADLASARSVLRLLGVSEATIDALGAGRAVDARAVVPAPISGVVTERAANVGLNVDPGMTLFTVVDLSSVWIVADLPEQDFGRVREGSHAAVTTPAYPDLVLRGRVSYIDPTMAAESRTAGVRIEVANVESRLRLGMFVDVAIETPGSAPVVLVPHEALQQLGARQVVYIAAPNEPGTFIERDVLIGERIDDMIEVLAGLDAGNTVVTKGSFFVRAERDRLGLRPRPAAVPAPAESREIAISLTEKGFEPARVTVPAGQVRLVFTRTTDATCATEVVFPARDLRKALPLNVPTSVVFAAATAGEIAFACGMDMLKGTVVVR